MRFLSLVLSFLVTVQTVSANEGSTQGLKALYDDLQYSLTVEWDQKDVNIKKKIEARFTTGLEELKKQGLTNQELLDFTVSQFKNKKAQSDFVNLINSLKVTALEKKEVLLMVETILQKEYQSGANWIGDLPLAAKIAYFTFITAISAGLIYAMINGQFVGIVDATDQGYGSTCTEVYVCEREDYCYTKCL